MFVTGGPPETEGRIDSTPPRTLDEQVRSAALEPEEYGRPHLDPGATLVEFVSADPTGPLTLIHGRGAVLGDTLARLMEWAGRRVWRETYVNDVGPGIDRLARSVEARYLEACGNEKVPFPEDGFNEPSIAAAGRDLLAIRDRELVDLPPVERLAAIGSLARDLIILRQNRTLDRLQVRLDRWFREETIHRSGAIHEIFQRLDQVGALARRESAVWLHLGPWGHDEDRILQRSSGELTYLAADLAYHLGKCSRGFDEIVNIWPADHASHAERMSAGVLAAGVSDPPIRFLLFQPVSVRIDEMLLHPHAGRGNNMDLDGVVEEAGVASVRLLLLLAPPQQPLEIDLSLSHEGGPANPAWRVYQALARLSRLIDRIDPAADGVSLQPLQDPLERRLIECVAAFPALVQQSLDQLDPGVLARWLLDTASASIQFEDLCGKGSGALDPPRRLLADAAANSLRRTLGLLGLPGETEVNLRLARSVPA